MPYFKPASGSHQDMDYTPQFYCQRCGAGALAVSVSEHKVDSGVMREIVCPACHCMERVCIQLAEDCSGWVLFQPEEPDLSFDQA
jgi:hypothetical protein